MEIRNGPSDREGAMDERAIDTGIGDVATEPIAHSGGRTRSDVRERLRAILSLMASPLTDEVGSTKSVLAGLATIVAAGTSIGLATPGNPALSPPYRSVSAAIGYVYFLAWSVSFYPQVVSNFKRRSAEGLSPDFVVLNVIGFACYTAYNASFFWNGTIRDDYKKRFGPDAEITVQSNDVAFAIHALVLSFVTFCQIVCYGTGTRDAARLSEPALAVIAGIASVCVLYPLLVVFDGSGGSNDSGRPDSFRGSDNDNDNDDGLGRFNWLDFLYVLSYVKIFISLVKYVPQVLLNARRKSTVGWSIWNILLDFTGGTLSDLQLALDCANLGDFSGVTRNKAKLALGSLSIAFDVVFLVQHYWLYASPRDDAPRTDQTEPLLPPGSEPGEAREEASAAGSGPGEDEGEATAPPETIFV